MALHCFPMAVDTILKNWTALQLAVAQEAAGHQSAAIAQWMVQAVVQWFGENKDLQPYEVAEFLEQLLNQELNLLVQDGSTDEVGALLCDCFDLCSKADEPQLMQKLDSLPRCDLQQCRMQQPELQPPVVLADHTSPAGSVTDQSCLSDAPASSRSLHVDADGWTTVASRKKK